MSSTNVSSGVAPFMGMTVRSRSTWPHPSSALGMSGAPMSSAPLMTTAFTSALLGEFTPTCSRMNSRVNAVTPEATAVACEVPDRDM